MSNNTWGGRRSGAGFPYRKRLVLDEETARTLRTLLLHRRDLLNKPDMTEEDVVKSLIDAAWYELDQHFQEAAEELP